MSFLSLPAELQVRIITECIRARQVTPSFFVPRRDDPSVKQATGLALVSRRFNALVASILFRNIRLTRPSSLLEIQATLRKRPELAALIVKLHIGPDNELLGKGWPIETDGRVPIRTTLSEDDEETLPLWCEPGTKFDINSSKGTCQAMAVDKAIRRAMYDIDVEPLQRGYSVRGKSIGVRAWAARLCLLQAAVDIYLIKMRYVEDVRHYTVSSWYERDYEAQRRWTQLQCKTATCTHYPRLEVLHDSSTSPLPEHINHFNVTQGQLWQHLLRRGGAADHFDHLVRLTRSTPQSLGMVPAGGDEWRRVKLALGGPYSHADADTLPTSGAEDGNPPRQSDLHDSESEDGDTFPSWVDDESDLESAPPRGWRAAPHPLDGQRVEDLLHACRSVLRLTTNLKTLSLTSYLHRALPYISDPKQLGCCVIGPRARYWDDVLPFEGPLRLDSLARLRVVGMMSQGDAAKVTELPLLQKVEWVLPVKDVSERKVRLNILQLQGESELGPLKEDDQQASRKRSRPSLEGAEDHTGSLGFAALAQRSPHTSLYSPSSSSNRSTCILLHPQVTSALLDCKMVPARMRDAWPEGKSVPGTLHRIQVASSDAILPGDERFGREERIDFDALYARGREWWEEG